MRDFPWLAVRTSCSCLLFLLSIVIYSTTQPVPFSKLQIAAAPSNNQTMKAALCPQTSSNLSMFLRPIGLNTRANTGEYSYLIPPPSSDALTEQELEHKAVFVFIHINKAGGTLFKYKILHEAAKQYKWDGAGFGSVFGWQRLSQPCNAHTANMMYPAHTELESFACGQRAELTACGPRHGGKCPMRVIWGSHSLPLCTLVPKGTPCVMAVVLRHPVDRLISQYNYVCIEGSEGRKKWSVEWKRNNYCPLTLLEFLNRTEDLTSETFLIDHLAMSPRCGGSEVAIQNLKHPCMRYLLLDRMQDGIRRLSKVWGPAMRPFLQQLGETNMALNTAKYSDRIQDQMSDPAIIVEIQRKLQLDIHFYEQAVAGYEEQWSRPLHSCL